MTNSEGTYKRIQAILLRHGINSRMHLSNTFDLDRGYVGIKGIGPRYSKILEGTRKWLCPKWSQVFPLIVCDWAPSTEQ